MKQEMYQSHPVLSAETDGSADSFDTVDEWLLTGSAEFEQSADVARMERDSSPQLDWPESDAAGHISDEGYIRRMNYRLTLFGFALDGSRQYVDTDEKAQEWLELKQAIADAKLVTDVYNKSDYVHAVQEAVLIFVQHCGTTQADIDAVR